MYANHLDELNRCRNKLYRSVQGARYAAREFRANGGNEWKHLAREAMQDARYWKSRVDAILNTHFPQH